jgi:hypothetical protein
MDGVALTLVVFEESFYYIQRWPTLNSGDKSWGRHHLHKTSSHNIRTLSLNKRWIWR